MTMPPTYCITCRQLPERRAAAERHLVDVGVTARYIEGIHGLSWGLANGHMGLNLSHWMLWQYAILAGHDEMLVFEDDCILQPGFREEYRLTRTALPDNWQFLFVGSVGTEGKKRKIVNDRLVTVDQPFGTHCYLVRRSALPVLMETCQTIHGQIDLIMWPNALKKRLRTYVAWPSLASQKTYTREWVSSCGTG